jgi:hypothetical protein
MAYFLRKIKALFNGDSIGFNSGSQVSMSVNADFAQNRFAGEEGQTQVGHRQ